MSVEPKVGSINRVAYTASAWNAALFDFCVSVQNFNIRGQRDEIPHPGYVQEHLFCPETGAPIDYAVLGLKTYKEMIVSPAVRAVERLQSTHPRARQVEFAKELQAYDRIFFNHDDFLADYHRVDCDFIYDARSGLYLVGNTSAHVVMLGYLYCYHTGKEMGDFFGDADSFVAQGFGLLKSRAGCGWVYRGKDFTVPAALASISRDMKVMA